MSQEAREDRTDDHRCRVGDPRREALPPGTGVFALNAFVIHAGRVYLFGTNEQPGREALTRTWFASFLREISFDV